MPDCTVSWGYDTKNGQNVGNSYSEYIIKNLLRENRISEREASLGASRFPC